MDKSGDRFLSKREQQIMELIYQRGPLSANQLMEDLPGSPTNSTVRTILRILEEKGHLRHTEKDGKFIYEPTKPRLAAATVALKAVLDTFFRGSIGDVVATLLSEEAANLTEEDLTHLQTLIEEAKKEGR